MALAHEALLLVLLLGLPASSYSAHKAHPAVSPTPAPTPAPAPASPAFCNVTQIIQSAGQFLTFLQLMSVTGVGEKFQSQANQASGITIFVPVDRAFAHAPAFSLLSDITLQQKVSLCEYHALPSWSSLASLQQTKNTVFDTFATYHGGAGGKFKLNVTDDNGNVIIKTGWSNAAIASTLYNTEPCSIFAIDAVLLPEDIFGLPAPAPAPAPSSGAPEVSPSVPPSTSTGSSSPPRSAATTTGPSSQPNFGPSVVVHRCQALLFLSLFLSTVLINSAALI